MSRVIVGGIVMGDYGKLPFTGAGITIGSVFIDQFWLAGIAVGLVVIGAVAVRLGFRRGKDVSKP